MYPARSPFLLALFVAVTACAGAPPPAPDPPRVPVTAAPITPPTAPSQVFVDAPAVPRFLDPERRKKLAASFPAMDEVVEAEMKRQGIPGVAVGIVVDGELAWSKGYGVTDLAAKKIPDADTVYRIGSLTKSFTGLALLSLRDDGALALDEPLTRALPEAAGIVYPTRDALPITLRQLATHTSGLQRDPGFDSERAPTEEVVLRAFAGLPLELVPGTKQQYSNYGFSLLGLVIARAAHTPYRDVIARRILAPNGMTSTFWDDADVPAGRLARAYRRADHGEPTAYAQLAHLAATEADGGIYSTVRDLARYVAWQLAAYPPRDAPEASPIKRSTVRESHTTGVKASLHVGTDGSARKGESAVDARADNYGFGWAAEQTCDFDDLVRHSGAIDGYTAAVQFLTQRGVGVVVLANLFPATPAVIANRVTRELLRSGGLAKRAEPLAPAFEPAMKSLVAVMNTWDEAAYGAMLGRPKDPREREELAGYHERHGDCTGFTPIEIKGASAARFRMECERGRLEMDVKLSTANGRIVGFEGTSEGAPVPPELRRVVDRVVGLVGKWDDAVYKRHLAPAASKPVEGTKRDFESLRREHGACKVKTALQVAFERHFALTCDRGELRLDVATDPKRPDVVTRIDFGERQEGTCPVR